MGHHIARRVINLTFAFLLAVFSVNLSGVLTLQNTHAAGGNNASIKINGIDSDDNDNSNENDPHVDGCSLKVQFFGYDTGLRTGTVTFEAQPPTDGQLTSPTTPQSVTFTGSDQGGHLDYEQTYTLAFTGAPHAQQGYHIKITAEVDKTNGQSKKKFKTIWVRGCEQPANQTVNSEWTNGTYTCGDTTVTQTRTVITTPYKWNGTDWVLDTANSVTTTETQTRRPTSEELKSCSVRPDDDIIYSQWVDGTYECGDTTVVQTRTKTVTPYVWNGTDWVPDGANAIVTNETQTRPATDDELKSCPVDEGDPIISATAICDREGVIVTIKNDGNAAGDVLVNGIPVTVAANTTLNVTVPFNPLTWSMTVNFANGDESPIWSKDFDCTPGRGGAGGEQPQNPGTPQTPAAPANPAATDTPSTAKGIELPQTGSSKSPAVQLLSVIAAGLLAYGAVFSLVNRRDLPSRK